MKRHEVLISTSARAIYIKIQEGRVARTKEISEEVFVDVDGSGRPLGVELLNPGSVVIEEISRKYHIPFLRKIAPDIDNIYKKLRTA